MLLRFQVGESVRIMICLALDVVACLPDCSGLLTLPACVCWSAEVLLFALVANTSIASLNLSLLINSVGFYQASDECQQAACFRQHLPRAQHTACLKTCWLVSMCKHMGEVGLVMIHIN